MFKDTSSLFERRKKSLVKIQDKTSLIKELLIKFFKDRLGGDVDEKYISIDHNARDNTLIINTANKILASEITFQLAGLQELLKTKGIKLDKILIR